MAREKRPFEMEGAREGVENEKRPRSGLARVIVEAVKIDSFQKVCSSLEPLLRKVVGEEVERALVNFRPPKVGFRSLPKRIQGPNQRNLRLQFRNKLALPLFTGSKVDGEQGSGIHVALLDADTGQIVSSGPEASAKLDIVVLEGDFAADDEENWSQEEFENAVVRERDGKRPLLTGELSVVLKSGVAILGELTFTDNSSWIRSRKFRIGVKVSEGILDSLQIREAVTEAFTVKDHRGELYKKHYPPALHDEVWRLDKIGKDGAFHKRLNKAGLWTVEDFLRLVVMDPQRLRNILGGGMSNRMWDSTVEHAKTCILSGKLHVYYADDKQNIGVIFNNIFQLMGLIADGSYMSVDSLSESEKVYVDKLVKVAYENWESVVEYEGEALADVQAYPVKGMDTYTEDPITRPSGPTYYLQGFLSLELNICSHSCLEVLGVIPVRLCRMVICVKEPNAAFVMWDLVAYRSKVPSCDHKGLLSCAYIGLIRTFEQQHRGELFLAFGVLILLVPPNYGVGLDGSSNTDWWWTHNSRYYHLLQQARNSSRLENAKEIPVPGICASER
ncbi:unnamed protein product [Sphagnum jensenii]|uniref:Uncharacterized protein n=2 Tax=Sphagnum jensenii TaxID=128206 RepID=A0ABP1ATP6_9BRYO